MEYKVGQERIKLAYYEDGKSILTLTMNTLGLYTVSYQEMVTGDPSRFYGTYDDINDAHNAFINTVSFLVTVHYTASKHYVNSLGHVYEDKSFYNDLAVCVGKKD